MFKNLLISKIFIFILLFLSIATSCLAEISELPLTNPNLEQIAQDLFKNLRCEVCNGQSIHDSNAELANDMRMMIRSKIQNGDTPTQIKAELSLRFGEQILMKPPLKSQTLLLWLTPFILVAIGVVVIIQTHDRLIK